MKLEDWKRELIETCIEIEKNIKQFRETSMKCDEIENIEDEFVITEALTFLQITSKRFQDKILKICEDE